jgi:predicted dehydrogenase
VAGKLRYGIVGLGTIGTIHGETIRKHVPEAEIAAVCDILPDRLAQKADLWGVRGRYADFREMVKKEELDAVHVCVPNHLHHPVTLAAFAAGRNVFCEKPMALNAAQAREMTAARDSAGKVFQLGMVTRLRPNPAAVKRYVESGFLGRIYHARVVLRRHRGIPGMGGWFTTKAKSGGGAVIDMGVHYLDQSLWLTNRWNPERVSAATYAVFGSPMRDYRYIGMWAGPPDYDGTFDVDDNAAALVRFADRTTMSIEFSWAVNAREENYIEILGDKAGVRVSDSGPLTFITEVEGNLADVTPQFDTNVDNFGEQAKVFARAVRGEAKPPATAEQGIVVMSVIDAIYRSSESGKEVEVAAR